MISFFRNLSKRLDQADKFDDQRNEFYEERLSHLADRTKELQDLWAREREILESKIEIHEARIAALDFWTRDVGRHVGVGSTPANMDTEFEANDDPLDTESWDDELNISGMATMWPSPLVDDAES